jgi:hypothetical protein
LLENRRSELVKLAGHKLRQSNRDVQITEPMLDATVREIKRHIAILAAIRHLNSDTQH